MLLRPARLWIATLLASACTHDATLRPDSGGEQASVDAGMRESGVDAPSDARVPQDMDAGEVARDASAMDAGDASIEVGDARVEVGDARVGDASADPDGGGMGPRAVRLRFRAVVGALPFACGQTYGALGTDAVSMESSDFRFYVQSVRLINARGEEVPVALETRAPFQTALAGGVALLDFEDGSGACGNGNAGTPEQNLELTGTVPDDDYRGIAFVNGVPESLNYLDPATLPDPLRARNMHWDWLWGYRFFKADLLEVSDAAVRRMFEVHVGSIGCTGDPAGDPATTCKRGNRNEVRLEGFDPDRSVVVADLAALFAGSNLMLGPDGTVCRSGSDTECSAVFTSLGIDFQTGEPLLTQSVFRVESP